MSGFISTRAISVATNRGMGKKAESGGFAGRGGACGRIAKRVERPSGLSGLI